jgi:hypothetical protein
MGDPIQSFTTSNNPMIIDAHDLLTVKLKYHSSAKPFKTLAFAQLIAKILFLHGGPLSQKRIRAQAATALGVHSVSKQLIHEGVTFLRSEGKITGTESGWSLTDASRQSIESDSNAWKKEVNDVLSRHFLSTVDESILHAWFTEASASLFSHFGDDWVASASRSKKHNPPPPKKLSELVDPATKKHGLSEHRDSLRDGYLNFLASEHTEDHHCLMGLGFAMFSARLVAADVGVDPLTIQEFRGARILLDTNLILALVVGDRRLIRAVRSLAVALGRIDARLMYIRPTKDEYERAVKFKRQTIIEIVSTNLFEESVLSAAGDDFIETARSRGCKTREDYDRFFDQLAEIPGELAPGQPLPLHEDERVAAAVNKAERDTALMNAIQRLCLSMRPEALRKEKGQGSLKHDSALIHVTEMERELGDHCWVLSLDKSLQACSSKRAGPHQLPTVLSVDALIEILAVDGAGPLTNSSDFAPLLGQMIVSQCEPPRSAFRIEDLRWMTTMKESLEDLPPEVHREMAVVVAKARVEGAKVGDAQLQLKVQRLSQERRLEQTREVAESKDRVRLAEARALESDQTAALLRDQLIEANARTLRAHARTSLWRQYAWRIPLVIGGSCLIGYLVTTPMGDLLWRWATATGISVIGTAAGTWTLLASPWRTYRAESDGAQRKAAGRLSQKMLPK